MSADDEEVRGASPREDCHSPSAERPADGGKRPADGGVPTGGRGRQSADDPRPYLHVDKNPDDGVADQVWRAAVREFVERLLEDWPPEGSEDWVDQLADWLSGGWFL